MIWLIPILWTFYISLRPYEDTQSSESLMGWPQHLNFDNYTTAWKQSDFLHFFINSAIITIPAVIITLFLASLIAFAVSRYSFRFNLVLLLIFTAGNLLPPQIILVPLYRIYLLLPLPHLLNSKEVWYDSYWGVAAIHIAFQMGFATFVLSNFMKALPTELTEAALVDGAGVWTQYRKIILPLCRPALAALGVLMTTWIYNDFLWALVLMSTGSQTSDHGRPEQPQGRVLHRPQPARCRRHDGGDPDPDRVLRAAEAVRRGPHDGRHEGLSLWRLPSQLGSGLRRSAGCPLRRGRAPGFDVRRRRFRRIGA